MEWIKKQVDNFAPDCRVLLVTDPKNKVHEPGALEEGKKTIIVISVFKLLNDLGEFFKKEFNIHLPIYKKKEIVLNYSLLDSESLIGIQKLVGNLYFKLTEKKYVCLFKLGSSFEKRDYDYYKQKKKIESFYIDSNECYAFALQIQEKLFSKNSTNRTEIPKENIRSQPSVVSAAQPAASLTKPPEAKFAESISPQFLERVAQPKKKGTELISELKEIYRMSDSLGLNPEVQEVTKKVVANTMRFVRNTPQLSSFLSEISIEKKEYISQHSLLLAYVSCALSTQVDWSSDTTYQKLTLASFLHDISLKNQDLAAVQDLNELKEKTEKFKPEELKAYKDHPLVCSELARGFNEVPPDVDLIIVQHHEKPDGTGFPRGLTHLRIGPLSSIFIVAHDLVHLFFKNREGEILSKRFLEGFYEERKNLYRYSGFKKVLSAILKLK